MMKIVIADPDRLSTIALKKNIKKILKEVIFFEPANQKELLQCCIQEKPDVIFLDFFYDNIEDNRDELFIEKIYSRCPIYFMTIVDCLRCAKTAIRFHAQKYLLKPIAYQTIQELLIKTEKESKDSEMVKALLQLLQENDYRKIYNHLEQIIEKTYQKDALNVEEYVAAMIDVFTSAYPFIASEKYIEQWQRNTHSIMKSFDKIGVYFSSYALLDFVYSKLTCKQYPILTTVIDYINAHIDENIGLTDIIKHCSISQGYVSRIFKSRYQITVLEYLHMRKINRAKYYFCYYNFSVTDAAFQLGYTDSGYFSKVFKKYELETVVEYKKKIFKKKPANKKSRLN